MQACFPGTKTIQTQIIFLQKKSEQEKSFCNKNLRCNLWNLWKKKDAMMAIFLKTFGKVLVLLGVCFMLKGICKTLGGVKITGKVIFQILPMNSGTLHWASHLDEEVRSRQQMPNVPRLASFLWHMDAWNEIPVFWGRLNELLKISFSLISSCYFRQISIVELVTELTTLLSTHIYTVRKVGKQ